MAEASSVDRHGPSKALDTLHLAFAPMMDATKAAAQQRSLGLRAMEGRQRDLEAEGRRGGAWVTQRALW